MRNARRSGNPERSVPTGRQIIRELEAGFLTYARKTVTSIQASIEGLKPGEIDDITARHLQRQFSRLRTESIRYGFLELGEIALGAEAVFAAIGKHAGGFQDHELRFLRNVARSVDDMLESIAHSEEKPPAMELVGDGFDRLLLRLERA